MADYSVNETTRTEDSALGRLAETHGTSLMTGALCISLLGCALTPLTHTFGLAAAVFGAALILDFLRKSF